MACRCAPSLIVLRNQVDARWPGRDHASDGCCGDAAHVSRKSEHNPATSGPGEGYAHALDIDEDIVANMGDRPLWATGLLLLSDPRTKYLIYEAQLLYPDGTVKPYTGINAHRHHLHVSIKPGATFATDPWPLAVPSLGPTAPLPVPLEVEMFVYRQSNTPTLKLYEGKGRIRAGLTETIATDLLTVLDQRPQGPGTDRKEWVLSKETVAWLEGDA